MIDELANNTISAPIIFLLDVFFAFIYTLLFILILYYFSNGEFRWYFLLSLTSGTLLYKKVFDKLTLLVVRFVLNPLKLTVKFIYGICIKIDKFFTYSIEKLMKKRYNKKVDI